MNWLLGLFMLTTPILGYGQIAAWDFTGESAVVTSTAEVYDANMDASNLITRGASAAASAGSNSFRTQGFQNNGIATSNNDYFSITLSAASGFAMTLSSIDARVSGTSTFAATPGVSNQFAYSLDGVNFTLIGSPSITIGTNQTFNVDLTGVPALQNVPAATTVTLRYYASGQTVTGGWGFFSNTLGSNGLAINGAVNVAGGCGITIGSVSTSCNALTPGIDTYDLSIDYTGLDAGVTINYGGSGSVGGDDPAATPNGTIVISAIDEGEAYNVTFSAPCDGLAAVTGNSPVCEPPACGVVLGTATAVCNTITAGTGDTYDVSIPYSGIQSGIAVTNNGASGTVSGDDPSAVSDGTIVISGVSEVDGYSVSLTSPCDAQSVSGSAPNCDPPPAIKINETDYDNVGTDDAEWIELYNAGGVSVDMTGFEVRLINGSNQSTYATYVIPAVTLAAGDYYVIGNNAAIPNIDQVVTPSSNMIQNGAPDGIVLYSASNVLLDALSYEGTLDPPNVEGTGTSIGDDNTTVDLVIARVPNGADSDDNSVDWALACATPGASNDSAPDSDLDGTPDCLDTCPLAVDGIADFDVLTCSCNVGFDPVTSQIGPNTVITACAASACDIILGAAVAVCNTITAGPGDTYNLSIAYSGVEAGVTVVNNSGSGTVGGDDPALVPDGTIIISGISESDAFSVTLTAPCTVQVASGAAPFCEPLPSLVINEVDYDETGTDFNEYVEILNTGAVGVDLTGMKLVLVNGSNDTPYATYVLNNVTLAAGDYYVVGSSTVANVDQVEWVSNGLQNGSPDGVRLTTADDNVLDQMSYEGDMASTEGTGAGTDPGDEVGVSLSRIPDGSDTNDNSADFVLTCSTPGAANTFPDADSDGTPDCLDVCPAGPEPFTACDDGNANTSNDIIQLDCTCAGEALDCNGVPGGPDVPGASCDDFDPNTVNDVLQADCSCAGQIIDCLGTPGGPALPGTPCNDFNPATFNDVYGMNCLCEGVSCTEDLVLEFQNDANPGEVSWEVLNEDGTVTVLSGPDPIPANSIGTQDICLGTGCYRLRVLDAGGDGMTTGGYELRETGASGRRIIDNTNNFSNGTVSAIAGGGTFCLPIGDIGLIDHNCDKLDWTNGKLLVCHRDAAVAAEWVSGGANNVQSSQTGYNWWIFDPNGTYSYKRFRSHRNSDGYPSGSSTNPARADRPAHFKINAWADGALTPHIPDNVMMNVRVRPFVNLTPTADWGPACQMMLDPARAACPLVWLQDDPTNTSDFSCNVTRNFGGTNSSANRITAKPPQIVPAVWSGQVRFQFRFRIPAEGVCIVRPVQSSPTLYMNWSAASGPQLQASKTYEVEVRVSKDFGATWCVDSPSPACDPNPVTTWGRTCSVTIGSVNAQGGSTEMMGNTSSEVLLFPNPNTGDQVFISARNLTADAGMMNVELYDATGKQIATQTFIPEGGVVNSTLDIANGLSNGLYLVSIQAGEVRRVERLVVQH